MDATSNLQWIWMIETLACSNEIDTSLLIDLVKQAPQLSDDTGRNAKELLSLRCLETLFVNEMSDANNDPLVFADNIGFDQSIRSEDVLCHLLSRVSSDEKMAGPQVSRYDVGSFITKRRSCLPKCALQQIKDAALDSTNPLSAVLKAESRLEVSSHFGGGGRFDAGIKQTHEVRGTNVQHEHVYATPHLLGNTNDMQENQPRTLVSSKRRIEASTAHEGEQRETEPISDISSDPCTKAFKKFKQDISPRLNVIQDFESSHRVVGLSAGISRAMVQKENLENGALVGGWDSSCEYAASKLVIQSTDSSRHDELLTHRMNSEEKIQNVRSSSKAYAELRTSSGASQQAVHQNSCIHGTEDRQECSRGDLFKDGPSKGAKENIVGSDEPEFSTDSDGYHNEKTGLSAKRNDFVDSQCTQGQDSLATENGTEINICVKCHEGGQLFVCTSDTCLLVVHQSCLGSVATFDNGGNFYCPFCAYSRAISECQEVKKMALLARKDLTAFFGFGARQCSKKSACRAKPNGSREDEELCCDKNNKDSLNEVIKPVEPVVSGQKSKKLPPKSHDSKQKMSSGEKKLCNDESNSKKSLNEVKELANSPVNRSSSSADVAKIGLPQPEACASPERVSGQSSFVEESSEDEDTIESRYCVRFRNADKNYAAIPQVKQKRLHRIQ